MRLFNKARLNRIDPAVVSCTGSTIEVDSSLVETQSTTPSRRQDHSLMKNNINNVKNDAPVQGSSFGEL